MDRGSRTERKTAPCDRLVLNYLPKLADSRPDFLSQAAVSFSKCNVFT